VLDSRARARRSSPIGRRCPRPPDHEPVGGGRARG
jgi:hypothetical protein